MREKYSKSLALIVTVWICIIFYVAFRIDTGSDNEQKLMNRSIGLYKFHARHRFQQAGHSRTALGIREYVNWTRDGLAHALERPVTSALHQAPGEMGKPVKIDKDKLSKEEKQLFDMGWKNNAFNEYASNIISLHRKLPDIRDPRCKSVDYSKGGQLPDVSVIIIFHQEAWSTLLRTVHSVIDRTPTRLLREVVLVDDNSNMSHLLSPLDQYIKDTFAPGQVKLLRSGERIGLIRARIKGALAAVGDVLIFLDSHCEATTGWVEPLLGPILENNRSAVVPIIEAIKAETLEIVGTTIKHVQIGAFDWGLIFRWFPLSRRRIDQHKDDLAPLETPTMAGGLFAIDRRWFSKLGMYDSGFRIWGGENLELSFKVWMCGGRLLTALCSHVGHIFRQKSPYNWGPEKHVLTNNLIRLALVWLDDYKEYYLQRVPKNLLDPSFYGDISEQVKLRQSLKCHDFDWYRHNVFPEMFVPSEAVFSGAIKNMADDYCVDSFALKAGNNVTGYKCHGQKGNQLWFYTRSNNIRRDIMCISASAQSKPGSTGSIKISRCPLDNETSKDHVWIYTQNQFRHESSKLCLELMNNNEDLVLAECDTSNARQHWIWQS